jgi:hypothetical protein
MIPPQPPTNETPWERFERFAKKVIAVPKNAVVKPKAKKRKRPR